MVFIGVMGQNPEAVSKALATVGMAQPMSYWGYSRDRIANICHHGLCAFVREHLPPDVFAQVTIPETRGWWPELFEATRQRTVARPFVSSRCTFGGELAFLDEMAREMDDVPE